MSEVASFCVGSCGSSSRKYAVDGATVVSASAPEADLATSTTSYLRTTPTPGSEKRQLAAVCR